MKIIVRLLTLLITIIYTQFGYTQPQPGMNANTYSTEIQKHRKGINIKLKYGDKTPLSVDQLKDFNGLNYFSVDNKYYTKAILVKEPIQEKHLLQTSTDREPEYIKYGKVHFLIDTFNLTLTAYQTPPDKQIKKEDNSLFIPFKDETSGIECYGGGRYIEFDIPEEGDTVYLDFNKAYNPYCAYNHKFSCVIPPPENWLPVRIEAGEKKFEE